MKYNQTELLFTIQLNYINYLLVPTDCTDVLNDCQKKININ